MNIAWWVQRWKELHPEKAAILFEGSTITYHELHLRANRVSCWLQSLGIEKGDRVAVMMRNCPEFIDLYLACARLGAIFVPINFRLTGPELKYILGNAQPRLFVFGKAYRQSVNELKLRDQRPAMLLACLGAEEPRGNILGFDRETRKFDGKKPFLTKSLAPADPEEPHVIMYTSGTTGSPKGAVLSYRKTLFNCLNADLFFKLHFDDIMLIILPLFHSGGLFIQASPILYKGGTMIIHPRFDAVRAYLDIKRYSATKFLGVPTIYRALLEKNLPVEKDVSSLRVSAIGGEKVTPELQTSCRKAGFPVRQIMGQTETSILFWASEEDSIKKPGTVGRPVFHSEVILMDDNGRAVKAGDVGEIAVRGSIMMKEYWQDPARTEETIRNGWLHTGDLARMDEEGYFFLVDRVKNMYISGGENVYPVEVEGVLKTHEAVKDAVVVGVPDDEWGERGKAFVVLKKGANATCQSLLSHCEKQLARYKWPGEIVFCEEFPRTALGKVKKMLIDS
ncbi:putative long-chain-fatty-acid--CoA ligase [delta proteobacterium NaphS2]|nr:putative long-chain-fatty-acid--CoA ligase [delta proteobacterium NaphS2]